MTHKNEEEIDLSKRINVRWELTKEAKENIKKQQDRFAKMTGGKITQNNMANIMLEKAKI